MSWRSGPAQMLTNSQSLAAEKAQS
jgi:hypothetical protein